MAKGSKTQITKEGDLKDVLISPDGRSLTSRSGANLKHVGRYEGFSEGGKRDRAKGNKSLAINSSKGASKKVREEAMEVEEKGSRRAKGGKPTINHDLRIRISQKITDLMSERNFSYTTLVQALKKQEGVNISEHTIRAWERQAKQKSKEEKTPRRNTSIPSINHIISLARVFRVSTDEILGVERSGNKDLYGVVKRQFNREEIEVLDLLGKVTSVYPEVDKRGRVFGPKTDSLYDEPSWWIFRSLLFDNLVCVNTSNIKRDQDLEGELRDKYKLKDVRVFKMPGSETCLFSSDINYKEDLDNGNIENLRNGFKKEGISLSQNVAVRVDRRGSEWLIIDKDTGQRFIVVRGKEKLNIYNENYPEIRNFFFSAATAHYLEEIVAEGASRIGLGSGVTVASMMHMVKRLKRGTFLFPMLLTGGPYATMDITSIAIVAQAAFKHSDFVSIPGNIHETNFFNNYLATADALFFSVGNTKYSTMLKILKSVGLPEDKQLNLFVGDILFGIVTEEGITIEDLDDPEKLKKLDLSPEQAEKIEKIREHPEKKEITKLLGSLKGDRLNIDLSLVSEHAKKRGFRTVAMVHGLEKLRVTKAAFARQEVMGESICNVLVTDSVLAKELLDG